MKTSNLILSAALAGALLAAGNAFAQDATPDTNAPPAVNTNAAPTSPDTPPPASVSPDASATPQPAAADQLPPAKTPPPDTNAPIVLPNGEKGLIMNFRDAPLMRVLEYMSDAAGFIIHPKGDVSGRVTVWSAKPVSKEESVALLKKALNENGYTVIQDNRILTIMTMSDATRYEGIPVLKSSDPETIPVDPKVVTQVIPVRTLNVVQLVKILQNLMPNNNSLSADESANALVLTDTQANIHRVAEIVKALDTITSANAAIQIFHLKFADAKTVASLIKDLFPSADASAGQGGAGGRAGRFRAMMMGGGGFPGMPGGGADTGGGDNGRTPTAKVGSVSDDHSNSLVVSAPEEMMPLISNLVSELDIAVEDTTIAEVFHLKNADPGEMADLLTSLFPDDSNQADATSRSPFGFRGFPFGPGGGQQQANNNSSSDRMKKMAKVIAVPDRRTSTLIVTAGTNVMGQISNIVMQLDESSARKITPHIIALDNANPIDVQQILQEQFNSISGTPATSRNTSVTSNPLQYRQQTILQQQNSASGNSFGGIGSSSRTGNGF